MFSVLQSADHSPCPRYCICNSLKRIREGSSGEWKIMDNIGFGVGIKSAGYQCGAGGLSFVCAVFGVRLVTLFQGLKLYAVEVTSED